MISTPGPIASRMRGHCRDLSRDRRPGRLHLDRLVARFDVSYPWRSCRHLARRRSSRCRGLDIFAVFPHSRCSGSPAACRSRPPGVSIATAPSWRRRHGRRSASRAKVVRISLPGRGVTTDDPDLSHRRAGRMVRFSGEFQNVQVSHARHPKGDDLDHTSLSHLPSA